MIRVSFEPLADVETLGSQWRGLEIASNPSFYTTWTWMHAWLLSLPSLQNVFIASLRHGEVLIGLAIVAIARRKRFGVPVRQVFLNQFGDPVYDSLFIEFNGVLSRREHNAAALDALIEALIERPPGDGWDELHLAGIQSYALAKRVGNSRGLHAETTVQPAHYVDLLSLSRQKKTYSAALGQNTRRRVKRAIEEYEKLHGPVKLDVAPTAELAVTYLQELVELHQRYWVGRGETGAFANSHFLAFHRNLVMSATGQGADLIRITAGDKVLGYLYIFVAGQVAYYYQSGFDYSLGQKHNAPGYVCLCLATEYYLKRDINTFEFLAGTEEYKTRLGHHARRLAWVVLQRPRIGLLLERSTRKVLRRGWRLLRRMREGER